MSQSIDVNETSASKECVIYHYWYILDKGFKFLRNACNGCDIYEPNDINGIAILNNCSVDYCYVFNGIIKSQALNLLQNANLSKKVLHYEIKLFFIMYKRWTKKL